MLNTNNYNKFTKEELGLLTDFEIIEYLIQGNSQVIQFLFYEKCYSLFVYIIKKVFDNKVDKNELINVLYLYLYEDNWKKVREFEGRSKLTTWLSVVSVRFFIKKKSNLIEYNSNIVQLSEIENIKIESIYDRFESKIDLYYAINKLKNPRERFVIVALEIHGESTEYVAETLGITIENLYNIRKRAKNHLSKILKEYKYAN